MKGILFALFTTLLSVGCSEDAREEAVQVDTQDESVATFGDKFTIPDLDLTMIWVEPGTFMMGSPETEKSRTGNETQHEVTLTNGFYLGKYELTQAQWEKVMGSDPSRFKGADRPVENVSWNDVVAFCKNLTEMEKKVGRVPKGMAYQLPTEAQWEYAARSQGLDQDYPWGNDTASCDRSILKDEEPPGKMKRKRRLATKNNSKI